MAAKKIQTITKKLGEVYDSAKQSEKDLVAERQVFFDQATKECAKEPLKQKTINVQVQPHVDEYLAIHHPGWRFVTEDEERRLVIEEDPAYLKFSYTNPEDGRVYMRNVTQAGESLDDERLREENPKLWERITVPAKTFDYLLRFEDYAQDKVVKDLINKFLAEQPDERELRPLGSLPDRDLAALQPYLVPGKLTLKLEPVRKAKAE